MATWVSDGPTPSSEAMAAPSCASQGLREPPPHAEQLKEMLMQQAQQNEQLSQEMRARDWERWQLLQLLHEKDEQLAYQETAAARQRGVLASARDTMRYYRALCAFNAWRGHTQHVAADRVLSRSKSRLAAARLRHSCDMVRVVLRQAMARQLSASLHVMWFNTSSGGHEAAQLPFDEPAVPSSPSSARPPAPQAAVAVEPPPAEDQVLFATPRVGTGKMQAQWEPSPLIKGQRRWHPSTPSEASTCVPPSLLSQSVTASNLPQRSFAPGRLALALDGLARRRLLWAAGRWSHFSCSSRAAEHAAAEVAADLQAASACVRSSEANEAAASARAAEARRAAVALGRELARVEVEQQQDRHLAAERIEAWATCWHGLEARANGLASGEAALSLRLQETRAFEEAQTLRALRAEEELARRGNSEQAALLDEQQSARGLQREVWALQESCAESQRQAEGGRQLAAHYHQLLEGSEQSRAKHEARLARRTRWREEAELQIRDMVAYGEGLERKCSLLRRELRETRRRQQARGEQAESLRCALDQEEQLSEILKARLYALEQDSAELARQSEEERSYRLEHAASSTAELACLQQEREELSLALRDAKRSGEVAGELAVEAARHEVLAAWERDRSRWAEAREDLEHRASEVKLELEAAERAGAAETMACMEAKTKAEAAAQAALREEEGMRARHEAAMLELAGESEVCKQATEQLEVRLTQARRLQEDLEERLAQAPAAPAPPVCPVSPPPAARVLAGDSGPPTPQLRELDAYAELVERLQAEVSRERTEREASASSLAALRGSYRLLLQRASSCSDGLASSPELAKAGVATGTMPVAWAVH